MTILFFSFCTECKQQKEEVHSSKSLSKTEDETEIIKTVTEKLMNPLSTILQRTLSLIFVNWKEPSIRSLLTQN